MSRREPFEAGRWLPMPAMNAPARLCHLALALALCVTAGLSACASTPGTLQPFTTDGCSAFPDRDPVGTADWCSCCLQHDLAYWRGGTADERLQADEDLRRCVQAASGSAELGDVMFTGVRVGGTPFSIASYRWGYGWSKPRGYEALSAADSAQAAALRSRYVASNPTLACPASHAAAQASGKRPASESR